MVNNFLKVHKDLLDRIFFSLLVIGMFVPGFFIKSLVIALFGLYAFCTPGSFQRLRQYVVFPLTLLALAYPLLYLIDFVFIDNVKEGMRNMEIRAGLFVLPLFIWLMQPGTKTIQKVLLLFAQTTVVVALAGLAYRTHFYLNEVQDTGYFYNDNIVDLFGFQAVYYAFYANISIFIFLHYFTQKRKELSLFRKGLLILAIVFLFGENYLLASRLSMLSLYAMSGLALVYFIIKTRRYVLGISMAVVAILLVAGMLTAFPKTLKRFESIQNTSFRFDNTNALNHFNGEIQEENWNGFNSRIAIWSCATEVIKENLWIGVGHGDYRDELFKKYEEKNFIFGLNQGYGSHNMYLQNLIMFGLVGFAVFVFYLFTPLFLSIRRKDYLFAAFFVFFALAMLTEDVLAKNQGVVPFAFFLGLWLVREHAVKQDKKQLV